MEFKEKLKIPMRLWHLLRIGQLSSRKEYSFSDVERSLGYNKPRIDVREVLEFLKNQELIILINDTFPKRYKIRSKPILGWLRENTDSFEWTGQLIELTKTVYSY